MLVNLPQRTAAAIVRRAIMREYVAFRDASVAADLAFWLSRLDTAVFGARRALPVIFVPRSSTRGMIACYQQAHGEYQECYAVFVSGIARRMRRMRRAVAMPVPGTTDGTRRPYRRETAASLAAHEVRHRFQYTAACVRLFVPSGAPADPQDLIGWVWRRTADNHARFSRDMVLLNLPPAQLRAQLHVTEFDALVVERLSLLRAGFGDDLAPIIRAITMDAPEVPDAPLAG